MMEKSLVKSKAFNCYLFLREKFYHRCQGFKYTLVTIRNSGRISRWLISQIFWLYLDFPVIVNLIDQLQVTVEAKYLFIDNAIQEANRFQCNELSEKLKTLLPQLRQYTNNYTKFRWHQMSHDRCTCREFLVLVHLSTLKFSIAFSKHQMHKYCRQRKLLYWIVCIRGSKEVQSGNSVEIFFISIN